VGREGQSEEAMRSIGGESGHVGAAQDVVANKRGCVERREVK
jgi:hypothetical protein